MSSNIMKIENFSRLFPEIKICSGALFKDERGFFSKNLFSTELKTLMPNIDEVFYTSSKKNVIRGMHFQTRPHELKKIIYCVEGEILDVFLDVRFASKTFGQFGSIKLKEGEAKSIFIPNGFAHGYATISNNSKVVYLQSGNYTPDYEYTINPMSIEFDWLVNEPTMSKKDSISISFDKFADNQN